nr:reverse transcriptase domain-containing protein [Tanacetum cinerariifolium]
MVRSWETYNMCNRLLRHKAIHGTKPNKTIRRHNGPKPSPCQIGYGPEAARQMKGFQMTLPQDSGSPLSKPKSEIISLLGLVQDLVHWPDQIIVPGPPIQSITFSLTYGTEAVIPAEIEMPTLRTAEVNPAQNDEALGINLDLLEEKKEQAAIREAKSKAKIEKYYNFKVQSACFKPGDLVYRNNDASRAIDTGKLGPK